jgi:hypothetical protein
MAVSLELKTALFQMFGPYWYVFLVIAIVLGFSTMWLYFERQKVKKHTAGSSLVRTACYVNKKTLGRLTDKAGTEVEFICSTNADNPGKTEYKNYSLINPNLVDSKQRGRLTNGTPVMCYSLPFLLPVSHSNLAALSQLMEEIKERGQLSFLTDDLLKIQVLFAPDKYLTKYCKDTIRTILSMGIDLPYQEDEEEYYTEEDGEQYDE